MSRTMYDACNPAHIPADAQMVAGYIEGPCAWSAAAWARFPHAVHVPIATVAKSPAGVVIDVEAGDSTPELAVQWVIARRDAGVDPTVYCSASTWPVVVAAFKANRTPEPHYWIAHYGVAPIIPAGAVALQYANEQPPGCDTSIVADYWPGVDPAPEANTQGEHMQLYVVPMPVGVWCLDLQNGRYFHVATPEDETSFIAQGAKSPQPISAAQHAVLLATYPSPAVTTAGAAE